MAATITPEKARQAALSVAHLWQAPPVVRRYLWSGDPSLADEALREARHAIGLLGAGEADRYWDAAARSAANATAAGREIPPGTTRGVAKMIREDAARAAEDAVSEAELASRAKEEFRRADRIETWRGTGDPEVWSWRVTYANGREETGDVLVEDRGNVVDELIHVAWSHGVELHSDQVAVDPHTDYAIWIRKLEKGECDD